MATARSPCRCFKTRVLHFKVKNTPLIDKKWKENVQKNAQLSFCGEREAFHQEIVLRGIQPCYFGGARSKGFATLRNVSKLQFFDKIGHAKSVGFGFIRPFDEVRAELIRDISRSLRFLRFIL